MSPQRTVKFRPDQPLFKADAFRMPLWLHAPWEVLRGIMRWLFVALERDNPHRNAMVNATLTRPAKTPHRVSYWTGNPVKKPAKWHTMARRWGLVFSVLAALKYLPMAAWAWLAWRMADVLRVAGVVAVWSWAHWAWLPVILAALALALWGAVRGFARARTRLLARQDDTDATQWWEAVLYIRDTFVGWVKGRGGRS